MFTSKKLVQRRRVQDLELDFCKRVFQEFDADGSQSIDLAELKNVMEAMGHEMTPLQLRELLEQVDVNRSGDLSFSEFVQLIALWKAASQFKLFDSDAPTIQDQRIQDALEPDLLLSDSWHRIAWDSVVYLVCLYSFFLISYILTTLRLDDDGISNVLIQNTFAPDIVATVVFGVDIVVGFLTAQQVSPRVTDHRMLDSLAEVAGQHLRSPVFYMDLFALLPLHRFVSTDSSLLWLGFNTIFRIFKVPRLFQRSQRMQLTATYVYVHFYLIPLAHGLVGALLFVHLLSCFWTLVQRAAVADGAPLVNTANLTGRGVPGAAVSLSKNAADGNSTTITYVASLYFILATVTTTGYGDIYILQNDGRIVAACILCVIGTLTTGIVIGNIVSTLSKTNIHTDRENKLVQTLAVLNYFSVPGPLANEILNFQNHVLLHDLGDSHRGLIGGLPAEMQKNISLFSRINLVSECELFTHAHQGTKVALAEALLNAVFRPDENVVVEGRRGDVMYFVSYGVLGMKLSDNEDRFFQRGSFFGEVALLCEGALRTATIKALTYCDLYLLSRDTFRSILYRFPKFRVAILEKAQKRKMEMIDSYRRAGNTAKVAEVEALVFINEEPQEAALLEGIKAAAAESEKNAAAAAAAAAGAAANNGTSAAQAGKATIDGSSTPLTAAQQIQVASAMLASSSNNNIANNNNGNSAVKPGRSPTASNDGGGEQENPDADVRADIKQCSHLLTEMHGLVHGLMHGLHLDTRSAGGGSQHSRGTSSTRGSPVNVVSPATVSPQQPNVPSPVGR